MQLARKDMNFTNATLGEFRTEFSKAVKDLEEKQGIVIDLGNISYNSERFTTRMTVINKEKVKTEQEIEEEKFNSYANAFKRFYKMFNLPEDSLNKTFIDGRKTLKFVGLDMKKRAYPCILVNVSSGSQYKTSAEALLARLK